MVEERAVASCRVVEGEGREVVWVRRGEFRGGGGRGRVEGRGGASYSMRY